VCGSLDAETVLQRTKINFDKGLTEVTDATGKTTPFVFLIGKLTINRKYKLDHEKLIQAFMARMSSQ